MYKYIFFFCSFFFVSLHTFAEPLVLLDVIESDFAPVISEQEYFPYQKAILFDASESKYTEENGEESVRFFWNFHDGTGEKEGKEVVYTFNKLGKQLVSLRMIQGEKENNIEKTLTVFDKKKVLITDMNAFLEFSEETIDQAKEKGTFLKVLSLSPDASEFASETTLLQMIGENISFLQESDTIIFATHSFDSLSVFTKAFLEAETDIYFPDKTLLVKIVEGSFSLQKNIVYRFLEPLKTSLVFITRTEALLPLFEFSKKDQLESVLEARAIEYDIVDENSAPSGILVFSRLISLFLQKGLPANSLYLLLAFPFIAFMVAFFRQFVGMTTYGVYIPIMLSLSFFVLGIEFGVNLGFRYVFRSFEMLYIPRVALNLSLTALSFLGIIYFAVLSDSVFPLSVTMFPLLVITTLSERFVSLQSHEGNKEAVLGVGETFIVAFVSYYFLNFSFMRESIMALPELVILPLFGILLLGKYSGLRLTEFFKFRALLREGIEE
jgi:hypothetical protein